MLNKITNLKSVIGKTIKKSHNIGNELWISFTDDSFIKFTADEKSSGFSYPRYEVVVCEDSIDKTDWALVELGLVSKKEYDLCVEEQEKQYILSQAKYKQENEERVRKMELEMLNKLKEKYK